MPVNPISLTKNIFNGKVVEIKIETQKTWIFITPVPFRNIENAAPHASKIVQTA